MTQNVLVLTPQILSIIAGIIVLSYFALTVALPHVAKKKPGSSGHRRKEDDSGHEEIRADGFIDSFAGTIEEAGGGLPPIVKLAIPGILIWWLVYLILFWTPK